MNLCLSSGGSSLQQVVSSSCGLQQVVSSSTLDIKPVLDEAPISKTMRYKKITKPLLERKRRARINACLDELKDIMTVALQAEGENVSKLEKADILELTVRHLHKLNQAKRLTARNPLEEIQKFQAGYSSCAQEATSFLLSTPGMDARVGQRLLSHLFKPALPVVGGGGGPAYPGVFPPNATASGQPFPPRASPAAGHAPAPVPGHAPTPAAGIEDPQLRLTGPMAAGNNPAGAVKVEPSGRDSLTSEDVKPLSLSKTMPLKPLSLSKTVPVKPSPLRLAPTHTLFEDKMWKPYS